MEPTNQQSVDIPNVQHQSQPIDQPGKPNFDKRFILIIVAVIIVAIVSVGLIVGYVFKDLLFGNTERKDTSAVAPQDTKIAYLNDYWGFSVKYPKDWFFNKGGSGRYYSFASYNQDDYPVGYIPNKQQLNMIVRIMDESVYDRAASGSAKIKEIGNLKAIEEDARSELGPRDRDIIRKYNSGELLNDHYTRSYYVKRNGYTFAIIADRADSILLSNFEEFVSDFQFTKMMEYVSVTGIPPDGKLYSQDVKLGYIFEYPSNFSIREITYATLFYPPSEEKNILIAPNIEAQPISNTYNDSENFETNIIRIASDFCAADGPMGSMYCPKEGITLKKFKNKYNVEGYEVYRVEIHESYLGTGSKTEQRETLFVYKLDVPDNFMLMFTASTPEINNEMKEITETFRYLPIKK